MGDLRRQAKLAHELLVKAARQPRQAFWRLAGGGIGAIRKQMAAMSHQQHQAARRSDFASAWQHGEDVAARRYASYEEYLAHQISKLDLVLENRDRFADVGQFKRHLSLAGIKPPGSVLCLAARTGTEVEAFIALGHFAVGIDLRPGSDNRFVVTGDFHALQFAPGSIDCVYTNSLDHAFDLERIAAEVRRVLKPGGLFLVEIWRGFEEGKLVGEWGSMHWRTARGFAEQIASHGFLLEAERDLSELGMAAWRQYALVKPAS